MAASLLFAEDLTDDVLSQSVLLCRAPDALNTAGTCRALLAIVTVTAHRLFATLFGSPTLPACLSGRRPRLLALLDRARSRELDCVRETFGWAAAFGLTPFIARAAAQWSGSDVSSLIDHRGADGGTALCRAAKKQRAEAVLLLLQLQADPDRAGKGGLTPLFWAARSGDPSITQRLLDRGASPVKASKRGDCPLGAVLSLGKATPGKLEALRLMCEQLDAAQRGCPAAVRALYLACSAGEAQYVELLVDFRIGIASPTLPGTANENGVTPPSTGDSFSNPQQVPAPSSGSARASPATGAAANAAGSAGAALFGGAVAVAAPLSQRPAAQRPALQRSRTSRPRTAGAAGATTAVAGAAAVASSAPSGGAAAADADWQESTPLLAAVSKGFSDVVSILLERQDQSSANINATLPSGKSALYLAAERGDAETCAKLLDAGATLAATTCSGRSVLFSAVEHGHVEVVRAICERAEVWHLTQQTPSGVSPLTLAERRGKPSLIMPLLRCYHRHVRRRYLLRQPGEAVADITDPYLTLMCLKFKDQLFRQAGDAGDSGAEASLLRGRPGTPGESVSQTSRLARSRAGDEPAAAASGTGRAAARSLSATGNRYSRVMEQSRPSISGGTVEGRCRLRAQLDLPESDGSSRVTRPLPQSARPRSTQQTQQARRGSDATASSTTASAGSGRRPWGSAAPRPQRPMSATPARCAPSRHSGSSGSFPRSSSGDLWNRAAATASTSSTAANAPSPRGGGVAAAAVSAGYVVGPIGAALRPQASVNGPPEIAWLHAGPGREEAAMEADDAMAALLAGYLSDEDDAEAADEDEPESHGYDDDAVFAAAQEDPVPSPSADRSSLRAARAFATCDLAMYSDDSEDEEDAEAIQPACRGG